ncbi:acyloxyacyl hydrolase [Capnocytophaga sp. ARDL2]|uniref:acyloxyacyl hydrolase n=1 Tax=Capnocytophaga sp. ARDL2 TaxID=3238809 RepID=UPI003557300F
MYSWLFLLVSTLCWSQNQWSASTHFLHGTVLPHSENIQHLIANPSNGFLLSIDQHQLQKNSWNQRYNQPELGLSIHGQFNKNEILGNTLGLYAHYSFYLYKRDLQLKVAQGISYATHPFDAFTNYRNTAYGSHWMPSTFFMLNYQKRKLIYNWGLQAGLLFIHHSNGSIKAPNTGTNTFSFSTGINYTFNSQHTISDSDFSHRHPSIQFIGNFRTGINESHIVGMGQKPFFHLSLLGAKKWDDYGSWQLGTEFFWSYSLKELTKFLAVSFPKSKVQPNDDWKRMGVFIGYEWYLNRLSVEGQIGYYVYNPYREGAKAYQRLGLKYYFTQRLQGLFSLKTHTANAEALEFGVGYKLF